MQADRIIQYLEKEFPSMEIKETSEAFIMPTICHNHHLHEASHKLYLYKNENEENALFHCYTECSETFNIYQLIIRRAAIEGQKISFKQAYRKFNGKEFNPEEIKKAEEKKLDYSTEFKNPLKVQLKEYPEHILDLFSANDTHPWALEGIDLHALRKYEVVYSKSYQGVLIPHRDWRGRMVGLRIRTYDRLKADGFKYMPAQFNNLYYRHPTSLNLYGIYQNQNNIKLTKEVYLFEGEKSVLQYDHILEPYEVNNSLAVCGQNISQWQIAMLIFFLGVERVYIGFDKEYSNYNTAYDYVERIKKQMMVLKQFAEVYVLIDKKDIFLPSESPTDRSRRDFDGLYHWKI